MNEYTQTFMMSEKQPIIIGGLQATPSRKERPLHKTTALVLCSLTTLFLTRSHWLPSHYSSTWPVNHDNHCKMPHYSPPENVTNHFSTDEFRQASIHRLSTAVTFPTMGYDDLKDPGVDGQRPGEDGYNHRWDTFPPFHEFLKVTYPGV